MQAGKSDFSSIAQLIII